MRLDGGHVGARPHKVNRMLRGPVMYGQGLRSHWRATEAFRRLVTVPSFIILNLFQDPFLLPRGVNGSKLGPTTRWSQCEVAKSRVIGAFREWGTTGSG